MNATHQHNNILAQRLSAALKPLAEPLAISFRQKQDADVAPLQFSSPPANKAGRTGAVAAGCVFWIKGADKTFATKPEDHANCSVGSLTHGLIAFEEAAKRDDVAAVMESGWMSAEQAKSLPRIKERPEAIIYGPLKDAESADVVLLRVHGLGLMILKDALPDLRIEGKPQCHIIALAKEQNIPAASLGCALSRARTGMKAEEMTCALPAHRLETIIDAIENSVQLNRSMARYAAQDAQRFAARST